MRLKQNLFNQFFVYENVYCFWFFLLYKQDFNEHFYISILAHVSEYI